MVDFFPEGGDVPLEKDVIEKTIDYYPTLSEWGARNFEQIIKNKQNSNSTQTLYTVPTNKTLFITSAFLSTRGDTGWGILTINQYQGIFLACGHGAGQQNSVSNSFPQPIKVEAGTTIQVQVDDSNTFADAGFVGFLVDSNIF